MILPGLGRVQRGAETAFIEVGRALSKYSDIEIECFGSEEIGSVVHHLLRTLLCLFENGVCTVHLSCKASIFCCADKICYFFESLLEFYSCLPALA